MPSKRKKDKQTPVEVNQIDLPRLILPCLFTGCIGIAMLVFLLQQSGGSSDPDTDETGEPSAEEQTVTTNWSMILCLVITLLAGGFILLFPYLAHRFFRCVIWIRFGASALPSRNNKVVDDIESGLPQSSSLERVSSSKRRRITQLRAEADKIDLIA